MCKKPELPLAGAVVVEVSGGQDLHVLNTKVLETGETTRV